MLLLIDNYDSFTHNLAQHLGEIGAQVRVVRNDQITVEEIAAMRPAGVVLSPGPCTPDHSGVCLDVPERLPLLSPEVPILGVCLGHQAIAQALGGRVVRARRPVHGKVWPIHHDGGAGVPCGDPLLRGLPSPFLATRYHSLVVEPASLPACLSATAWSAEGEIMAIRHLARPIFGIQFHPESIGTPCGKQLLSNFLRLCRRAS